MKKIPNSYFSMKLMVLPILMIFLLCSCADLVVTNIHSAPFTGPTRMIKGTVKNKGSKPAPASTTGLETRTNPSSPYTPVSNISTPPLNSGQEIELPLIPDPASCIHLRVCADINDVVEEGLFGESNNCTEKSLGCP